MRTLLCLFALPVLMAAQSPRERARLTALLPDPAALGGTAPKPARFYAADLYRYLDGGADAYRKRGFRALIHREYRVKDADLTVDIYDMGDVSHAAGMYAAERPPDCRPLAIGGGGYADKGVLNFHQERYYVKLMAFSDAADTAPLLEATARAISARVGGARGGGRG
jgi:hypothetical protein